MAGNEKENKIKPVVEKGKRGWVAKKDKSDQCPAKEDDNCKAPGVYNDSDPIGGGG